MSIELTVSLKGLQLYGMAAACSEWHMQKPQPTYPPEVWLQHLVSAEQVERQARTLRYQLRIARFPVHRDLLSIDWNETPLSKTVMEQLATAGFMQSAHNLILVGGTGKTHFATALGGAAIHTTKRVRFYNAVDLVHQLEREKNAIEPVNSPSN